MNTIHIEEDIPMSIQPMSGYMYNGVLYETEEQALRAEKRDKMLALAKEIFPADQHCCNALMFAAFSSRWQEFVDLAAS